MRGPATLGIYAAALLLAACGGKEERVGPRYRYELKRVIEVAGRQGVATDGEHYYVSGSTTLYRYAKDGRLLLTNEAPFAGLESQANHIGDLSVHAGELYAGVEHFEDGRGTNIQVAVYDAETLAYVRSIDWEAESGQVEVSAVAVDPANASIWMTDWVNGRWVYRYDLSTGRYAGRLQLRPTPQWQQGICAFEGHLFLTADDGDAEVGEHDTLWCAKADREASSTWVHLEREFDDFRFPGEIEGLDFDGRAREMVVLANRGKRIVLGMPKGLYPGYEREIHELYVYAVRER